MTTETAEANHTGEKTSSRFEYVTYIRATPAQLWDALIRPDFTRMYWCGTWQESEWNVGSPWKMIIPDGRTGDSGEVEEIDRPRKLVLKWRNEFKPDLKLEGYSRCCFDLESAGDTVKLTVTHEIDREKSRLIQAVSEGWPLILASLKSLIETGESLQATREWPEGA